MQEVQTPLWAAQPKISLRRSASPADSLELIHSGIVERLDWLSYAADMTPALATSICRSTDTRQVLVTFKMLYQPKSVLAVPVILSTALSSRCSSDSSYSFLSCLSCTGDQPVTSCHARQWHSRLIVGRAGYARCTPTWAESEGQRG